MIIRISDDALARALGADELALADEFEAVCVGAHRLPADHLFDDL